MVISMLVESNEMKHLDGSHVDIRYKTERTLNARLFHHHLPIDIDTTKRSFTIRQSTWT